MANFFKCFLIVFYSATCCSEVAVFQANNETLLFYPEGELEFFSDGMYSRAGSNVKYCNPDSGWKCLVSQELTIAIPNNDAAKEGWCFGGLIYNRINQSGSEKVLYLGENKTDGDLSVSLYDFNRGVMFVHFFKGETPGYTLISREGLLSNMFIESISPEAYLTSKELSTLIEMCPEYDTTLRSQFKRKLLNIPFIEGKIIIN